MELLIRVEREIWDDCVKLNIGQRNASGTLSVAQPLLFVEQSPGLIIAPCLRLETQEAQRLMDELWDCGLRPSEGTGSAGSLASTERHLKDMQTIAMGLLRKDGVGA